MTAVMETNDLGKQYGRKWALQDCTLSIPEGKVVGLVGPNGAGKTTLLSLAVGLLTPTRGSITVLALLARGHRTEPHRQAEHIPRTHGPADSRSGMDRQAGHAR